MSAGQNDWALQAKCHGSADTMFVAPSAQGQARRLCADCPVQAQCLAEALDNRIEWGVWGGKTERERRQLLRRHPRVQSWHAVLCGS